MAVDPVAADACEIVVVDDDPFALRIIDSLLRSDGHTHLHQCRSVAQALETLDALDARRLLLICDLNMPEVNGVEFLGLLAARKFAGSVLICSGASQTVRTSAANLAKAYGLHLCGMVEKPLAAKSFVERVRGCLAPPTTP